MDPLSLWLPSLLGCKDNTIYPFAADYLTLERIEEILGGTHGRIELPNNLVAFVLASVSCLAQPNNQLMSRLFHLEVRGNVIITSRDHAAFLIENHTGAERCCHCSKRLVGDAKYARDNEYRDDWYCEPCSGIVLKTLGVMLVP